MGILNRVSNTYKTGVVSHLNTQPYTSILKIFGFGQRKSPLELKMKFVVALMMMTMMVYCSTAMAEDPDSYDNYGSLPQELDEVEERARVRCNECGTVAPGNHDMACYSRGCQKCIRKRQPAGNCGRGMKCQYCGGRKQKRNSNFRCSSDFCQGCKNFGPRKRMEIAKAP